jgi:cytochrome c oxidase cbb3-type subunit III
MNRGRYSTTTILLIALVYGCEREVRDFHVQPAAANTSHSSRIGQLQPGTTQPSPHEQLTTTSRPSTSPTSAPSTSPTTLTSDIIPLNTAPAPTTGQSLLPPPPPVAAMLTDPPGRLTPPPRDYSRNAYALSEGKRLYTYMNCVGCHANGGGGMGPALMDEVWLYGSSPAEVYKTILHGRPNGMPAFAGRLPDYQLWQIAHYVRSISGLVQRDAAPSRSDQLKGKPPENSIEPVTPRAATTQ